jgi:alpha-L-fucosidase
VSENGNLLLNVVLYPDGSLPPESQALLADLKPWMATNAEAIYGTRPWKVFGEGPTQTAGGEFKESAEYTAEDIRFTQKDGSLYAITLGEPRGQVVVKSLGRAAGLEPRAVRRVQLLGTRASLKFQQSDAALVVEMPERLPTRHASVLRISL